ncbi:hypothetical protein SAMD00023353_2900490 [Rosellinia necatrix]|uniref:Uncharacterized protein n=1 Tax=Rosellinia necatrix TaxID=77044 RepID=A0A1S8A8I5_ROSNE|nr:hypothetical protein SAMD00023353_2900490 [Rosellinia necatrix]
MDIYGAFQICSIGILAAPVTVYNSRTYFNDPGRNIIFLWTGLLFAGILSLTVEFFRISTHGCQFDDAGRPIDPANFPYMNASCNLHCEFSKTGPFSSPIRQDATNEPGVIPAPTRLTFGTVILLAAASSIPPVLTLIFTWEKILEINWRRRFAQEVVKMDEPIEGTNGATPGMITIINGAIRSFLSTIQIPIFSIIVIVLLVVGEYNFWSAPVSFQTEPFSSVGQWANIVATVLIVSGSLFYVRHEKENDRKDDASSNHSRMTRKHGTRRSTQGNGDQMSMHSSGSQSSIEAYHEVGGGGTHGGILADISHDEHSPGAAEHGAISTDEAYERVPLSISNTHRNRIAGWLYWLGEYLETPAPDRYDNSVFRRGKKEFPEIPGEKGRVANFETIRDRYRDSRKHDNEDDISPGLSGADVSSIHVPDSRLSGRDVSPRPHRSPSRSNTTPNGRNGRSSIEIARVTTSPTTGSSRGRGQDMLEVPSQPGPAYIRPRASTSPTRSPPMTTGIARPPKIIVSTESKPTSPTGTTTNGLPSPGSH